MCYHPAMKRAFVILLLLASLTIGTWGCDAGGLPTVTPVQPNPTPSATSAPAETATSAPAATSTPQPTSTSTPSPTVTRTGTPLPATATQTAAAEPTEEPPTAVDDATQEPVPTATEETGSVEATPTAAQPRRPTPTAEAAPAGGWSEVVRGYPGKKRVALTFDAGSTGETMPAVLDVLRQRHIHITMFFTGKFVEQYPDGVKQAVADGHEIANHTYSHLDSLGLTDQQLKDELARTESIIYNLTGVSTKPYWRPPYGSRDNHVLNVAKSQGYRSIYWTLDSLDSVGQVKTPDFIFNRVTNTPDFNLDGAIILQHFGSDASAQALPRILDRLKEMGYSVVTISDLLTP
jgi:peptidoglycan-N-acetylmuramic acid deacetylase